VRAAQRLGHDLVDQPERLQAAGGNAERIGSFGQGYLQELLGDALIVER